MNVDADSLEQLNLRTRDGAEQASQTLGSRTDVETRLGETNISLASYADLVSAVLEAGDACLEFSLSGALSGTVVLTFDQAAGSLVTEGGDGSPVNDLSASLIEAFVTEWETHVEDDLVVGDPVHVIDPASHDFAFDSVTDEAESAPVFRGEICRTDGPGQVTLFLVPDSSSLEALLGTEGDPAQTESTAGAFGMETDSFDGDEASVQRNDEDFGETPSFGSESSDAAESEEGPFDGGDGGLFGEETAEAAPIPLDKLSVFSDLTRAGTTTAAERVTQMTGVETTAEISGINFRPIDDISSHLYGDSYVGTTTEFSGKPSGNLVIMFSEESARHIAESMLPMEPDGDGLTAMHQSALEELGNIMTSGFIDGWANVLQTSVDHTPPAFTDDIEMTMLELVTDQLGPFQTHAYTIESRITTETIAFDCEIHALPNEAQLSAALEELLVTRADQTEADPNEVF